MLLNIQTSDQSRSIIVAETSGVLAFDSEGCPYLLGGTPFVKPATVPVVPITTPDAQDVIDALVTLGLVTQSD